MRTRNILWARNPLGVYVKDHDGLVIFVPPRPDILEYDDDPFPHSGENQYDYRTIPNPFYPI